jgi:hypothetical protein
VESGKSVSNREKPASNPNRGPAFALEGQRRYRGLKGSLSGQGPVSYIMFVRNEMGVSASFILRWLS